MSIEIGRQIGTYKVVGPLGKGGMGEVFRATDTKLGREVAIKVLPDAMAYDKERVARFEREAKVLASLNHPMIAAIYGFDEADGKRFLVLELVEGPTLADRLTNGRLPVEESLDITKQIAEALEVAHDKGIIHRDLKPANVKVTPDGQVKVLDFGLAKALAEQDTRIDPGDSPTITKDFTVPGVVLGTAAYMSPEQARGRPVDKRSDIWSFGCVLYECLTGDSLFRGETVTDSIGAILHKQPDWNLLPAETPPTVQLLLRRCLAKDRKRRFRDIGDVRIELEAAIADPTSSALGLGSAVIAADGKSSIWHRQGITAIACAVLLTTLITMGIGWSYWPAPHPESPVRKLMPNLASYMFNFVRNPAIISPDGSKIVYEGKGDGEESRLWVQDLKRLAPRQLPGTDRAMKPFWSPDSKTVGYFADGQLWRVDVETGASTPIAKLPDRYNMDIDGSGAWLSGGEDAGRIIFGTGNPTASGGLWEVPALGGDPRLVLEPGERERDFEHVSALPHGRGVLFLVDREIGQPDQIDVFVAGKRKTVFKMPGEMLAFPVYASSGHILYERKTTSPGIWAVPFSLDRLETTGAEPIKVADGMVPSTASDGTLLYVTGSSLRTYTRRLVWIDSETGEITPIVTREQEMRHALSLSPRDETRALVAVRDGRLGNDSIWLHDLVRGSATRVTLPPEGTSDGTLAWHPDEVHFFFQRTDLTTGESTIMKGRVDGTGKPMTIVKGVDFSLSSDGKYLAYDYAKNVGEQRDIAYIALEEDGEPHVLRETEIMERSPGISPDGRLLAYTSRESDYELHLTSFPSGAGRWTVSLNGATRSFWGKDPENLTLYYYSGDGWTLFRVNVKWDGQSANPEIGSPQQLFNVMEHGLLRLSHMAPSRDGKRLVATQLAAFEQNNSMTEQGKVVLVQNWFSEFKNKDSNESP